MDAERPGLEAAAPPPLADASLYLHPQTLARLTTMELRAKHIVEGVQAGTHRSPLQGFSVEFSQHRPYVPGDDIRRLDWKVYARTDKLHLKQHQQETTLDLVILVDASGSMGYGSRLFEEASGVGAAASPDGRANWSKFDHATALAAAMAYITLKQGDRVGLTVFAEDVKAQLARSSAGNQWRLIVGALSGRPSAGATRLDRVIDQALAQLTNRCLIVFISDFFAEEGDLRASLARVRHRRHDMILFQVLDRQELEFAFDRPAPFEGMEAEGRVRIDPRQLRQAYRQVAEEHIARLDKLARSFGFDHHLVNTHDWLGPPLAAYLARRNAQIKRSKYG